MANPTIDFINIKGKHNVFSSLGLNKVKTHIKRKEYK